MVEALGSVEWDCDVEVFTPALITFILLCELYFKCTIQGGCEVIEKYFLS